MENIEQSITGDILTLKIDLSKRGNKSSTGKSIIVASSGGGKRIKGTEVFLNLSAYTKEGV
jgi:hypothetical protein